MQCTSCGTLLQAGVSICPNCGTPVATPRLAISPEKTPSFYDEYIPFTDQETLPPEPLTPPEPLVSSEPSPQTSASEGALPTTPTANPLPARRTPLLVLTTTFSIVSLLVIAVLVFLLIHNATQNSATQTPLKQFGTSDPQAIYTQVTTKLPAVNDAFTSQTSSTWAPTATGSCAVSGNALHVTAPQGDNVLCASKTLSVSNFACQVQITLKQGDTTGLLFRQNPTSQKLYVIELTTQGTYLLGTGQSGTTNFEVLAEGLSSTIHGGYGQPNLLTIIALGSILYLYVNKQFIVSTSDPSSDSGLIGIASGGTLTNIAVDATFSHFQVWKL
jgi:hypothetical protein